MSLSVSVITVTRNSETYLAAALNSIVGQTRQPDEILVVDGRSTDATPEIARSFAAVTFVEQGSLGLANARNLGIQRACGDLIAFLDSDDLWHPTKLERQVSYLTEYASVDYCLTYLQFIGAEQRHKRVLSAATPSVLVARRSLFETIGLFDPRYQIGCDTDWFTRARDDGATVHTIPEVLLDKRLHEANLSRDADRNRREMAQIAKRSIDRNRRRHGAHSAHQ